MKIWVLTALALSAVLPAATSAARPCRPGPTHQCFAVPAIVDLTTVPDISQRIVDREPVGQRPQQGIFGPSGDGYTGPTVGVSTMGRAPTVGYHWSLH